MNLQAFSGLKNLVINFLNIVSNGVLLSYKPFSYKKETCTHDSFYSNISDLSDLTPAVSCHSSHVGHIKLHCQHRYLNLSAGTALSNKNWELHIQTKWGGATNNKLLDEG